MTEQKIWTTCTYFGKASILPLVTYTDQKRDDPPRQDYVDTLWVERGEDWYCLRKHTTRIIKREEFLYGIKRAKSESDK